MDNKQNKYTPGKTDILSNSLASLIMTTLITILLILLSEYAAKQFERRSACAYMENAIFLQQFLDGVIEDLLDLTDSEDSSSSSDTGVFESHQPFVLELHDLVKDAPTAENPAPEVKVKKQKKKKGQPGANPNATSDTSSSVSESSVPPTGQEEHSREEFYDAHESYHGLTGNAEGRVKKLRKKKGEPRAYQNATSETSSSISVRFPTGLEEFRRKAFNNALRLPENQAAANPVGAVGLVQARSEHGATPKPTAEQTSLQPTTGSGSRREPSSTVTKPTTNPQ